MKSKIVENFAKLVRLLHRIEYNKAITKWKNSGWTEIYKRTRVL